MQYCTLIPGLHFIEDCQRLSIVVIVRAAKWIWTFLIREDVSPPLVQIGPLVATVAHDQPPRVVSHERSRQLHELLSDDMRHHDLFQ